MKFQTISQLPQVLRQELLDSKEATARSEHLNKAVKEKLARDKGRMANQLISSAIKPNFKRSFGISKVCPGVIGCASWYFSVMQETSPTSSPAAALAVLEWIFILRNHELVNKGMRNREFQSAPTNELLSATTVPFAPFPSDCLFSVKYCA